MQSLTEGKVSSLLIRFSGPFLLAGIVQMGHGLINVFLLSWLASPASVAGAFNGGLLVFTLTSVFMGLGTGGMILLGQFVGGKQDKNAAKAVGNTILVQFAVAVTCALFILALGRISIRILNVPYYLLDDGLSAAGEAWRFMRVVAFGMVFQTGYNIINSMLRALGDSKRPMIFIAISCVLNIGFDLIFIGVLHMGAAGAALGTVIAQVCGFTIALLYLLKKKFPFAFGFRDIRPDKDILKKTFKLGIPISMQMLLNMLSFTVIARIINGMGTAEAAANSLINTVFNFVIVVPSA
ncbi:MAG: MATE family efflux transporter, partial [Oscillospiraceae bacterium]|nr:MATE family efflux transporter [Oscillospiraceae bacterium]